MVIIILNIISLIVAGIYIFFLVVLPALAGMYNTSGVSLSGTKTLWQNIQDYSVVLMILITLLSLGAYFIPNKKIALAVALAPTLFAIVMGSFFYIPTKIERYKYEKQAKIENPKRRAKEAEAYNQMQKDYVSNADPSFLVLDRDAKVIVYVSIDQYTDGLDDSLILGYRIKWVIPVGKISGNTLELYSKEYLDKQSGLASVSTLYLDSNNKTIFDNYEVVYKGGQDINDYHLEKYINPAHNEVNISN